MAAKKPPTRTPRATTRTVTAQDAFTGLSGSWKQWSQFGVSGIVAGVMVYAVTVMIPGMMDKHALALKEAREQGFTHGEKAVEKLVIGMDRLGDKFGDVQSVTQSRQDKIIERIERTNVLLEATRTGKAPPPMPAE